MVIHHSIAISWKVLTHCAGVAAGAWAVADGGTGAGEGAVVWEVC